MITQVSNIPQELRALKQWVCWTGKSKVPMNPHTGNNAMSNNQDTWGTLEEAVKGCEKYNFDGVGFMFANGYFGVDLDHCIENSDFVDEFVETLQSYTEISMSGSGIHIICKGILPDGARRRNNVEMYNSGRYFACTGKLYNEKYKEVANCTESIKILHNKYLPTNTPQVQQKSVELIDLDDQEIVDLARNCKSGELFRMLYNGNWQGAYTSQSEADISLCNQLAFWTQRNESQMDRIFRSSRLMRKKWDEKRGSLTYGEITIGKACANCMEVYEPAKYEDTANISFALFKDGRIGVDVIDKNYDMTDSGNAMRLCDKYFGTIKYSYNRKKWYFWDGKLWREDNSGEIKKLADNVIEDMKNEAMREEDGDIQEKKLKWVNKTASSKSKESMIKECQHLRGVPAMPEDFDSYKDYLNCQNGIINLKNGELLPHDSSFMMSKICMSDYDEYGAEPKMWLKFLDDVTNGDKELQDYIQKCVGYSLSGSTAEQCAYFLYGVGNNGKSTFLETISDLLGNYSSNVQPETIMMQKNVGGANSDIARLKSARFVTTEEPTEGVRLNEGLLKQLTGGGKVTCRFLYGDEFEYEPEFKIWVATNHKPVIRGTDFGIWRRIRLIPFEVTIPKEKVDINLKYKLRQEFPQILHWAIDGCIKWQKEGIQIPQCVQKATNDYKVEMDLIAGFMEACIEIDYNEKSTVMASDIFKVYSRWAKENNEYEMSSKKFFNEISKKLPDKGRSSSGIYYKFIRFTSYAQENFIQRKYSMSDFTN